MMRCGALGAFAYVLIVIISYTEKRQRAGVIAAAITVPFARRRPVQASGSCFRHNVPIPPRGVFVVELLGQLELLMDQCSFFCRIVSYPYASTARLLCMPTTHQVVIWIALYVKSPYGGDYGGNSVQSCRRPLKYALRLLRPLGFPSQGFDSGLGWPKISDVPDLLWTTEPQDQTVLLAVFF